MAPNSPVQDRAVEVLDMLDHVEQERARFDSVKALLASPLASWDRVKEQFPEYFDPYESAKQEDGSYDIDQIDDADVEWSTAASPDEDEALSTWIAQRESGSFTGADLA